MVIEYKMFYMVVWTLSENWSSSHKHSCKWLALINRVNGRLSKPPLSRPLDATEQSAGQYSLFHTSGGVPLIVLEKEDKGLKYKNLLPSLFVVTWTAAVSTYLLNKHHVNKFEGSLLASAKTLSVDLQELSSPGLHQWSWSEQNRYTYDLSNITPTVSMLHLWTISEMVDQGPFFSVLSSCTTHFNNKKKNLWINQ